MPFPVSQTQNINILEPTCTKTRLILLESINYLQLQVVLTTRRCTIIQIDRWLQLLFDFHLTANCSLFYGYEYRQNLPSHCTVDFCIVSFYFCVDQPHKLQRHELNHAKRATKYNVLQEKRLRWKHAVFAQGKTIVALAQNNTLMKYISTL